MDIKEQINKIMEEVSKNPNIKEQFEKEPVKVIEKVIGVDLPDDIVMKIIVNTVKNILLRLLFCLWNFASSSALISSIINPPFILVIFIYN